MRLLVAMVVALIGVASVRAQPAIGYVQGRKVKIEVVDVDGVEVEQRTARAFGVMVAAAEADGIALRVTSGFRTYERQAELYAAYLAHWGSLAAKPGYSNHQSGRALDLDVWSGDVYAWLEAHATSYGFRRTVASEPWHWEYTGVRKVRRVRAPR